MATQIDEHPAFFDTAGRPLVGGSVFIGLVGADPEANPITIYSDRELTLVLANPQTINSLGRATNKIWIPGEYSMEVQDSDSVQVYIELENGVTAGLGGATNITNVLGTNTITGEGTVTPVTSYGEDEIFIFQSFGANTGAVTLNWDGVGARALVYDFDIPLEQNHIEADQSVIATYNLGEDNFQWVNPNRKVVYGVESASIASATTTELHDLVGNSADVSGTTAVTSYGTTPDGSVFWLTYLGAVTITYNASSLLIPGQANYITTAGDVIRVQSLGSGNNSIQVFREDGEALIASVAPSVEIRHQSDTTDATETGVLIKSGWGYITGAGGTREQETVTFPTAFGTELFSIQMSFIGIKTAAPIPTSINDFGGTTCNVIECRALTSSLSTFLAELHTDGTFISGDYYGYSWLALGN